MSTPSPAELFDLSGRVAWVTGASSGIGVDMAKGLAAAGATVVVSARRADRLAELCAEHPALNHVVCDVTDPVSIEAAYSTVVQRHGRVDVLVNNAGTTTSGAAETESIDHFRGVVEVNLVGLFALTQHVARGMLENEAGSIINIASIHGLRAAAPNKQAAYCATKAAVVNLTRELAVQWATRGVRVNALAPGYFPSELTEPLLEDPKGLQYVLRSTPMGRVGAAAELNGALLLLASNAGAYITGQVIAVDGGWTAR